MLDAKPMRGSDPDVIYAIHTGTEFEAEIRKADLQALLSACTGEAVAWYVECVAPGMKDHGTRVGPFFKREEAGDWVNPHYGMELRVLFAAPPRSGEPIGEMTVEVNGSITMPLPPPGFDPGTYTLHAMPAPVVPRERAQPAEMVNGRLSPHVGLNRAVIEAMGPEAVANYG